MAINAFKKLQQDLENNTSQVVGTVSKTVSKATSAGNAGTARVAHFGSSGTGALSGTAASV
jgi:hypothetical protein